MQISRFRWETESSGLKARLGNTLTFPGEGETAERRHQRDFRVVLLGRPIIDRLESEGDEAF